MAETVADRAWLAYHSLPRNRRGKPPSYRSLEGPRKLSGGTLSRLMMGDRVEHSYDVRLAIADALGTTVEFLWKGLGESPSPSGAVPPRLPYLNEDNDASNDAPRLFRPVDQAKVLLDRAAEASPGATAIELLARAQILAIQEAGKF